MEHAEQEDLDGNVTGVVRILLARDAMTRRELADALGYDSSTITRSMKGERPWKLTDIAVMAKLFDVPRGWFFDHPDTHEKPPRHRPPCVIGRPSASHLNPPVIVVAHGKGDRPRVIPVPSAVIDALRAHGVPTHGPVFRDTVGAALAPWKVSHLLREHIHNCGVTASGHQLRHTYGTELYRRSGDLRMTQTLMGHASPVTTAGYTAWAQDRAASVVATLFT